MSVDTQDVLDAGARADRAHIRSAVRPDHGAYVYGIAERGRVRSSRSSGNADRGLGCNLAWGLIDAIMYLMSMPCGAGVGSAHGRGGPASRHGRASRRHRCSTPCPPRGDDPDAVPISTEYASGCRACPIRPNGLGSNERTGLAPRRSSCWYSCLTIPVVLPFVILDNAAVALRISNAIAVAMMFVTGYAFGRAAGYRPWIMAGSMVLLGAFLVALTIALGG